MPAGASLVRGTLRDDAPRLLADGVDAVLHFAAKSLVGESMAQPSLYWENNLGGSLALLEAMRAAGTPRIVFSSTAAVYGEPGAGAHRGDRARPGRPARTGGRRSRWTPRWPSTRGCTAWARSASATSTWPAPHPRPGPAGRRGGAGQAQGQAAGRWLGERHSPETHLIPNVLAVAQSAARGSGGHLTLFGDDYPTKDGTCVRDYIHVADLARAHLLALGACQPGQHRIYNLGSESGFSNLEVLAECRAVTGVDIPAEIGPRRAGDPAVLVASSARIRADLGWAPERDLGAMVADAWAAAWPWPGRTAPRESTGRGPGRRVVHRAVRQRAGRRVARPRPGQPDR